MADYPTNTKGLHSLGYTVVSDTLPSGHVTYDSGGIGFHGLVLSFRNGPLEGLYTYGSWRLSVKLIYLSVLGSYQVERYALQNYIWGQGNVFMFNVRCMYVHLPIYVHAHSSILVTGECSHANKDMTVYGWGCRYTDEIETFSDGSHEGMGIDYDEEYPLVSSPTDYPPMYTRHVNSQDVEVDCGAVAGAKGAWFQLHGAWPDTTKAIMINAANKFRPGTDEAKALDIATAASDAAIIVPDYPLLSYEHLGGLVEHGPVMPTTINMGSPLFARASAPSVDYDPEERKFNLVVHGFR